MQDMAMQARQGVNIFESILEIFSTIASGATPIGSTGRAPDEVTVIRVREHELEHIIDYLINF
jgi:hypothetical protein